MLAVVAWSCGSRAPATPEELANQALAALRAGDESAFLEICATKQDVVEAVERSTLEAAPKRVAKQVFSNGNGRREWAAVRRLQLENFGRLRAAVDWDRAEIESVDYEIKEENAHRSAKSVAARLRVDGQVVLLSVEGPLLAPRGWCTAQEFPLRVRIGETILQ